MGVAGGEKAIWHREAGILLDSEAQFLHCLIEAPHEKMPRAYDEQRRVADSDSRTESESRFSNRNIRLACPTSEDAAKVPAAREIRIERQCAVNQRYHGVDVLSESGQRDSGIRKDARIVTSHCQGSPREIGALQSVRRRIFAHAVIQQSLTADRGPGECRPIMRIVRNRLLHKAKRLGD